VKNIYEKALSLFDIKFLYIFFILIMIGNTILMAMNYSNEHSFLISDPTILNYIEAYSDRSGIFRDRNYPTFNLSSYHPGPNPYMYLLYISWELNKIFGVNVMQIFNIFLLFFPILILFLIFYFLYKAGFEKLLLTALIFATLIPYTYHDSTISMLRPRVDLGTNHLSIMTFALIITIIYSIKKIDSSHLLLLFISGLTMQAHFSLLPLGGLAFIYAIYLIIKSNNRASIYKYLFVILVAIGPFFLRLYNEPLFLLKALDNKSNNIIKERYFINNAETFISYLYTLTPFQMFNCKSHECFNNPEIFVYITYITLLILFIYTIYKTNNFERLLLITGFLVICYQIYGSNEPNHGAFLTGIIYGLMVLLVSRFYKNLLIILSIIVIIFSYTDSKDLLFHKDKEQITIFSKDFLNAIKNEKFKFNGCTFSFSDNVFCKDINNELGNIFQIYTGDNLGQIFLLELLNNGNDVCLYPIISNFDTLNNLKCSESEYKDENRVDLIALPDISLTMSNKINNYYKIGHIADTTQYECIKNDTCFYEQSIHDISWFTNNIQVKEWDNFELSAIDIEKISKSASLYAYKKNANRKYYDKLLNYNLEKVLDGRYKVPEDNKVYIFKRYYE